MIISKLLGEPPPPPGCYGPAYGFQAWSKNDQSDVFHKTEQLWVMYFYSLPEPYFMKADQMAFEAEVRNQFERMTEMLNQLLQGSNVNNNGTQALDPPVPINNQDIIILGGFYAPGDESVSNTVEKFNIVEGKSD